MKRETKSGAVLAASLACLFFVPLPSAAQQQGARWTANVTVTKVVVTNQGGVNVRVSPDLTGCVSQSGYGQHYASIYPSHPGINRLKAMLLVAQINGTPIALWLSDGNCTVGEAVLGGW